MVVARIFRQADKRPPSNAWWPTAAVRACWLLISRSANVGTNPINSARQLLTEAQLGVNLFRSMFVRVEEDASQRLISLCVVVLR
jgi:hypothetical protein